MIWGRSAASPSAWRSRFAARVQALLEVDKGLRRPEPFLQLLARDQLPRTLEEHGEDVQRLVLEAEPNARLAQLPRPLIQLEDAEPDDALGG
jgi:hypothetical protein